MKLPLWTAYALVFVVTFLVYVPSLSNGWVDWDDNVNFIQNEDYRGLGLANLKWMSTAFVLGHYQPLSWVTLGLDYELWGMKAFGYHLTNVVLHACSAAIFASLAAWVFATCRGASPRPAPGWPEAGFGCAVALLWSLHPLRVEAVSWITERREVLCGMLTLLAVSSHFRKRPLWQTWVLAGLAMLAKVTAATIPALLVLIDVHRAEWPGWRDFFRMASRAVLRQTPLVLLAGGLIAAAFFAQHETEALISYETLSVPRRLVLTVYGAAFAVLKTFWPSGLAVLHQSTIGVTWQFRPHLWWEAAAIFALTMLLAAIAWRRRALGTLCLMAAFYVLVLPTGGLGQSGPQTAAERYTYQPAWVLTLGLGLALAAWRRWPERPVPLVPVVAALVALLGVLSFLSARQQRVWSESETLWLNQIAVHPTSPTGNHQLGRHYLGRSPPRFDLAEPRFRAAFGYAPGYVDPQHSLGLLLRQTNRPLEAIDVFTNLVRGTPTHRDTWFQLGMLLWDAGRTKDAVSSFDNFVRLDRANYAGWRVLAKAQAAASRPTEAVESFERGIAAAGPPERGAALMADLAWLLATNPDPAVRDGRRALEVASRALAAGPPNLQTVLSFGVACAEAGEFERGIREVEAAIPKLPPEVEPAMRKLLEDLSNRQVVRAAPRFP